MTATYASALSPEYALLGFLAQQPAHGYQLHQQLTTELGQVWHVSLSQTYNILKRLDGQEYVHGEAQPQEKLPARQKYHITTSGLERLHHWLLTPTGSSVRAIRVEFITRLYFARLLGEEVPIHLIEQQMELTQADLKHLRSVQVGLPVNQVYNHLGLDLRIRQLIAILGWLGEVDFLLHNQPS
jgi:DNA-binding PadR family transcriptional regulator